MLDVRERENELQEAAVHRAQQKVQLAIQKVEKNKQEIAQVTEARKHA